MKLGLYCSPLGGVTPPFGHSRKEIGTLVALGTLAVGVGSVIASSASQNSANNANLDMVRETNATNLQIARETNEMSQQQFNENMNWSKEQFGLQRQYALEDREYNSIQNQVKRALAAGINPSAVIGNGSAAHSTTPVGSMSLPSQSNFQTGYAQAGHVDPVNYDFSGISESVGHAYDAFNQSRLISANIDNMNADTQIKRHQDLTTVAEGLARVRKLYTENEVMLQNARLSEATRKKIEKEQEKIEQEMQYFEEVKDELVRGVRLGNNRVERETQHIGFKEMMEQYRVDIERDLADSAISLNSANSALAIANSGKAAAETAGIAYNNEVKSAADLVASTKAHLDEAQEQAAKAGVFKPIVTYKEYKAYKNALKRYNKVILYAGKRHGGSKH